MISEAQNVYQHTLLDPQKLTNSHSMHIQYLLKRAYGTDIC